ncbi:MAG TPA: HNH endonuclease signature motif containing protein [Pseudobdellovibrionaceae bacterium]|jgi:hypothetical protein
MDSNHSDNLNTFEEKLKTLEDQALIEQLQKLFERKKRIGDAILLNLQEIADRRLYAKMGYSSIFEFLVKHFHLSESAAYQRTNALKLIREVPKAQEALFKGETNLSTMAATQSFIKQLENEQEAPLTKAEKETIFDAVKGKSKKEAQATFAEMNPVATLPETKAKVLTAKHTLLQVTLEQETLDLINEIKNLLSHEIPDGHLNKVLKRMAEISVGQLKKKKGRSISNENSNSKKERTKNTVEKEKANPSPILSEETECSLSRSQSPSDSNCPNENHRSSKQRASKSRHIPIEIRSQVFQRAHGGCEYVSPDEQRCQNHYQLEVDHITSWSQGGETSLENCRVHCKSHNQYRVKETHGFWYEH